MQSVTPSRGTISIGVLECLNTKHPYRMWCQNPASVDLAEACIGDTETRQMGVYTNSRLDTFKPGMLVPTYNLGLFLLQANTPQSTLGYFL